MGHTNSTPNYSLPQFLSTDKPAWLTDINGAFSAIDTAVDAAKDAADAAQGDATTALSNASDALTAATNAGSAATGAIASIATAFSATDTYDVGDLVIYNNLLYICTADVTTPGAWTGATNWSRITLSDVTADLKDSVDNMTAADVDYQDFDWLTGKNVQTAINEFVSMFKLRSGTAEPGVIIRKGGFFRVGSMCILSIVFSTHSVLSTGAPIISDLPSTSYDNVPINLKELAVDGSMSSCRLYRGKLYLNVATTDTLAHYFHAWGCFSIED